MSRNKNKFEKVEAAIDVAEDIENIETEENIEEAAEPVVKFVKGNAFLRVRSSPKKGDNVIRQLKPGSEVKVYGEEKGWACINEDKSEYVMTEFLG